MAKIKITKRTVEALKAAAKDYIAFDTDLPGFGVRVMPSGKRFFLVQYRRHGRTRRVMIGQFGIVTAELARREATIKLGSVRGRRWRSSGVARCGPTVNNDERTWTTFS